MNRIYFNGLKKLLLLLLLSSVFIYQSCYDSDDVGDNYTTFTEEMMGGYLEARTDSFSEFSKMLDTTGVMGLLNAYGKYTCFAPTNEAMYKYYAEMGHSSLKDISLDSMKIIVYNHIIKDAVITSSEFTNGRLTTVSMNGRYISTNPTNNNKGLLVVYVDEKSLIVNKDIGVHNGVIHAIDAVLQPTDLRLHEVIAKDPKFTIFWDALYRTGLYNKITAYLDASYVPDASFVGSIGIGITSQTPQSRKYGFTVLMESDSTFKANSISTIEDMAAYAKKVYDKVYPSDAGITDITNPKNSLNRFIAYHLINKQLGYKKFIYDLDNTGIGYPSHSIKVYDMFEYIETLCPNTLLEVRTLRTKNEGYGVFNMVESTGNAVRINSNYKDKDALNGVYHEIDNILVYSRDFVSQLTSKRIRMDASSFFPELVNNNMRASGVTQHWSLPKGYLARLKASENTKFNYYNADNRFMDYQGDEVFMTSCMYDFEITTLPVPAGTYEIRFGYLANGSRGVAQLYLDGSPCGIPLNLNTTASDASIGYKLPGSATDDSNGYENDKMMHNRGYMKGPACFYAPDGQWSGNATSARMDSRALRRVLGIFTFKEDGTHVFSAKAAQSGEFMFDYLEFVPTEYIEKEGID
jgi:uncharacterized surface protein with fasciclin (FAS1) repeats